MKAVMIVILLLFSPAALASETRSVKVTAKSEIEVAPDEVEFLIHVETRDKSLLAAKRENDKIVTAVLALAPKHGLRALEVKVADLDVSPDYLSYRREGTPAAYEVTRSIEIRLANVRKIDSCLEKIEPFLSEAFDSGLSNVGCIDFCVSNHRKHEFEARKLAVMRAREKAKHLAELTGMKLGSPLRIEENIELNWGDFGFPGAVGDQLTSKQDDKTAVRERKIVLASFQEPKDIDAAEVLTARGTVTIEARVTIEFEMSPE